MNRWHVVQTHPHSEAKASGHLQRQGFVTYLPQARRWVRHARQHKLVDRPLFPRYIFVRFDPDQVRWRSIFSTVGVSQLVCHGDAPAGVPDPVIEEIRRAEGDGFFDETNALSRLRPGASVRVICGPFSDLVGKLQSLVAGDRVRVLLEILGREVPATMDLTEVAPA